MPPRLSEVEYIEEARGHDTPCWIWQRSTTDRGYGVACVGRQRTRRAHVVYYERANGAVGEGLDLDHLCGNRACVNPAHLEAVTHAVNCRRGRQTKLDWDKVRYVRASPKSGALLAAELGVTKENISMIRRGKTWKEA